MYRRETGSSGWLGVKVSAMEMLAPNVHTHHRRTGDGARPFGKR